MTSCNPFGYFRYFVIKFKWSAFKWILNQHRLLLESIHRYHLSRFGVGTFSEIVLKLPNQTQSNKDRSCLLSTELGNQKLKGYFNGVENKHNDYCVVNSF